MTLASELEARVRAVAYRSGLPPEAALSHLLEIALADEEQQFQETVAALQASMDDFSAGRSVSLEEWRADSRSWMDVHRQALPPRQQP